MEAVTCGAAEKGDGTMSTEGTRCQDCGGPTPCTYWFCYDMLRVLREARAATEAHNLGERGATPRPATDPPPMLRPPPDAEGAGR